MFGDYVFEKTAGQYKKKILLIDSDHLEAKTRYSLVFQIHGFTIVHYTDDLTFRVNQSTLLDNSEQKMLILANSDSYIPYDVQEKCYVCRLSYKFLFPKLNDAVLREQPDLNMELLTMAYEHDFENHTERKDTETFLRLKMYATGIVECYLRRQYQEILSLISPDSSYRTWFRVAELKADIDLMAAKAGVSFDTSELNRFFCTYAMMNFGKLSSEIAPDTPVLVSKVMDFIHERSDKFVLIVMDGMSEFDWGILKQSFTDIPYEQKAAFAMIPSTTSVSRQCLLSGKYPSQLMEPWKQSKEKTEFTECAMKLGFKDNQIGYARGYEAEFGSFVKCGAVIVLDIDNLVHAQYQGRIGMLNDDTVLTKQKKLIGTVERFLQQGYDVYISSDHGNAPSVGLGRLMGAGLEVETKSHKMVVLKDFADKNSLIEKYGLLDYPKYYLPKEYDYLICNVGESLDIKGEEVMTHGGISLDEVVVPFISIRAEDYNG